LEELTSENTYRDKCWPDLKPGVNDDDIKYGRKYITTGPAVKHFFPDFRMFIQFLWVPLEALIPSWTGELIAARISLEFSDNTRRTD